MKPDTTNLEKAAAAAERIPAVVYMAELGEHGQWIYVSPQIHDLLGYTPNEWKSESALRINRVHPDDRHQVLESERNSKQSGSFSREYRMLSRRGKEIWVRDEGAISENDSLCYGFLFDITKEKQAEERAGRAKEQIELERLQLEQHLMGLYKFEAIGRLAAGVAHDFNNLLMAITSYCELLKFNLSDPVPPELLEIQRSAVQGSVLTRYLLAFGGKQMQTPRRLDLNEVLKNLNPRIVLLVREDVQVHLVLTEDPCVVQADLSQMEDVIVNLAMVAGEAMPGGGSLLIETSNVQINRAFATTHANMRPGNYVQLSVTDTGPGLDEDARDHIFEPFYTRKDQTMGGGLRLPAVYGSVKQNGGYIWVSSKPGQGTTFRIYFQRVERVAENSIQPEESVQLQTEGQTILVVDDNDSIRVAISAFLEMNGFHVLQASNGKDALQVAASGGRNKIDLLITDLVMPQMGGLELSQHLAMRNPNLKVLYMSGYTEESIIKKGMAESGAFFLQKPASMQILLKKVQELLSS